MSPQSQALRGLVLERLAVAADEIFALFERTFAQYEEEVLRSKILPQQEPRVVLCKEDIQTVTVGVSSDQVIKEEPITIKQEANPPIELHCPSITLKCEEADPVEEKEPSEGQCDGQEPGCSSDMILDNNGQPYSCSDTDDSEEWEFLVNKTSKNEEHGQNASLVEELAENNVHCDDSFSGDTVMSNETEHLDILHRCAQCNTTFTDVEALDAHLEIHPGPFTCQICHKNYYFKRTYKQHLRSHAEKKPFGCSVCKRRFSQKRHMDEHMRIHTGETPFSCSDCGRKFRQRNSLMRHILTKHSEDKPYRCSVCQRGFVQKWHYVVHMRGHTGERPFSCSVCGQSYGIKYYLDRHMRTHEAQGEVAGEMGQ